MNNFEVGDEVWWFYSENTNIMQPLHNTINIFMDSGVIKSIQSKKVILIDDRAIYNSSLFSSGGEALDALEQKVDSLRDQIKCKTWNGKKYFPGEKIWYFTQEEHHDGFFWNLFLDNLTLREGEIIEFQDMDDGDCTLCTVDPNIPGAEDLVWISESFLSKDSAIKSILERIGNL